MSRFPTHSGGRGKKSASRAILASLAQRHGPSWQVLDPDSPAARKVARLPTHPPTCALCGVSEWTVAMTDRAGRELHVACCKDKGQ